MHQGAGGGIQPAVERCNNREEVDGKRQGNAELDGLDRAVGQALEIRKLLDVVAHQDDIGSFHGDVAAKAAHGDAHRRGLQGGGIVDAVANHAQGLALILQGNQIGNLLLRQ